MKRAAILAGGLGTRLRSVVSEVPKSLAPIHGKPFLFLLIEALKKNGIKEIILLTGYMHEKIQAACGDGSQWGVKIFYSPESSPLGTAGAIKNAEKFLKDEPSFLVLNGDSYAPKVLEAMALQEISEEFALVAISEVADASRFGTILFDPKTFAISAFHEKVQDKKPGYVNAGIYVLSNKILDFIPANKNVSIEQEIFPQLLCKVPGGVKAVLIEEGFDDIGLPETYAAFSERIKHEK